MSADATKKRPATLTSEPQDVELEDQIRLRAYELYEARGREDGHELEDWLRAEEEITGKKLNWKYEETNRIGDHVWWISDVRKFQSHYPKWKFRYGMRGILEEIHDAMRRS